MAAHAEVRTAAPPSRRAVTGWFADRKVGTKIIAAVGAVIVVMLVVVGVAYNALASTANRADTLYSKVILANSQLALVHQRQINIRADLFADAAQVTDTGRSAWEAAIASDEAKILTAADAYKEISGDSTGLAPWEAAWKKYQTLYTEQLIPLARAGDLAGWASLYDSQGADLVKAEVAALDALEAARTKMAATYAASAQQSRSHGDQVMLLGLVLGTALALGLAVLISRQIVRRLRRVSAALEAMAQGDLTQRVVVDSRHEVGVMAGMLNSAAESVQGSVRSLDGSAQALASSAEDLSEISGRIEDSSGRPSRS